MSAFWPLALFFAFSSFAFGCMEGWSIATCEAILFLGAALVGWNNREFWSIPKRLWLPALLAVVLITLGLVQLVPLPSTWWKAVGSERYTRYTDGAEAERVLHADAYRRDPFSPDADKPLPPEDWKALTPPAPAWIPASFTPAATGRALLALAAGLCLILLLERLAVEGAKQTIRLAWLAGGLGVAVAAVAFFQYGDTARTLLLWVRPSRWASSAFGPFVNNNHGAAFVNLTLPLLYFLLWRRSSATGRGSNRLGLRLFCAGLFLFHAAVLLTGSSQAAWLALALYPAAWLAPRGTGKLVTLRRALALGYLALLVCAAALVMASGLVTDHGRSQMNANVPFQSFVLGHGLNSFEERWPAETEDLPMISPTRNTHLENEYLQLFFEAGLLPALFGIAIGCAAIYLALRLALTSPVACWLAPALLAETFHASVDFTAHSFPLVGAFLLVWMLGEMNPAPARKSSAAHHSRGEAPLPQLVASGYPL